MILLAALASTVCTSPSGATGTASAITKAYGQRSLEIIKLAETGSDDQIAAFVQPDADFSLGAGDVGRPMGKGVVGARAMAADLKGSESNFVADSEETPTNDPCGVHEAAVGFSVKGDRWTIIHFRYDGGKLQSASGWWNSLHDGWRK